MTYQPIYKQQRIQQSALAQVVIPVLRRRYNPQSVADFGCGVGVLLWKIAAAINAGHYLGMDLHVEDSALAIPLTRFRRANLNVPPPLSEMYDLTISLEVAEHLHRDCADVFVEWVCAHTLTAVMFSAATPGQGGDCHYNEQLHEYWHDMFARHGFRVRDKIRPLLRRKRDIPSWYRNNIFLYERTT